VEVWRGITSLETKRALERRVPARKAQVSRLRVVLGEARRRKERRRMGGRKRVRRGVPDSRCAVGVKVYVGFVEGFGEIEGGWWGCCRCSWTFGGIGGVGSWGGKMLVCAVQSLGGMMGLGSPGGEMSVIAVESFSGRSGAEMLGLRADLGGRVGA